MEQKIIPAPYATDLNIRMANLIAQGWVPVGSHQVVTMSSQNVFSGNEHKRTQHTVEYSQTMQKK